jgi:NTE family protein
MFNPLKYFRNRKVGLALGSGGAKGLCHISVIEYLDSLGIPIHMISGSSIGAVVGAVYCAGTLGKFKEDMLKFTMRELLAYMDPVVPRSGFIEGKGFIKFMARYISRSTAIEDLKIPLAIVATDYIKGTPVIFRHGSVLEALRASVSIPGVLVPVRYQGTLLMDGGVANPLPVNVLKDMGAGMTIAVNLHPQLQKRGLKHYVKSSNAAQVARVDTGDSAIKGDKQKPVKPNLIADIKWLKTIEQWIRADSGSDEENMPNIFNVMAQSVDIMEYVNTALMLRFNSPTVLIEPNLIDVETLAFTEAKRIIDEGYEACSRVKNDLIRKIKLWV